LHRLLSISKIGHIAFNIKITPITMKINMSAKEKACAIGKFHQLFHIPFRLSHRDSLFWLSRILNQHLFKNPFSFSIFVK